MKNSIRNFLRHYPRVFRIASYIHMQIAFFRARSKWSNLKYQKSICLELGSGPRRGQNGWTTVDQYGADIIWDLRKGIPLPDQSVDKIYSSHLLEHIPYAGLLVFLKECRRVLRENGQFLVCVPNAQLYIEAYVKKEFFVDRGRWYQPALVDTGSFMDQLNYIAYLGEDHKTMFDAEYLINILKKTGFRSANLRQFDPEIDLIERDFESLYALASP